MPAMAAALRGLFYLTSTNPCGKREFSSSWLSPPRKFARGATFSAQRCPAASGSIAFSLQASIRGKILRDCYVPNGNRGSSRIAMVAAQREDSMYPDIELDSVNGGIETGKDESQKAWEQALVSFKQQVLKMQSLSQEAYEVYSKKALMVLEETSKNMKIQADKATQDIAIIVKEISEEGREYISAASMNSPEPVKDIVETFSAPPDEFIDLSKVRDFYLGIPYGALLALGGFASFMFTGSTSAIRFGIILGGLLLALSVSSLRVWKKGKTSSLLLKGQAVIASIIFIREWRLLFQKPSLPSSIMTITSGAMVVFYLYRIVLYRQSQAWRQEHGSED